MESEKKTEERVNVMLTCLSPVGADRQKQYYLYDNHGEPCLIDGINTNEAPTKRLLEKLHRDHGERLDRIVMICSKQIFEKIRVPRREDFCVREGQMGDPKGGSGEALSNCAELFQQLIAEEPRHEISDYTHFEYYKILFQHYAESVDEAYKNEPIVFEKVEVKDFLDEKDIAGAVTKSASKVMGEGGEKIDLYVEFNGGPRIVTALELILCNLMTLRNVRVREMTYMDNENKQTLTADEETDRTILRKVQNNESPGNLTVVRIRDMNKISQCMNLVTGITEYVNYGRIRTLKSYFEDCQSEKIQNILSQLEQFANNMQLCLTDYIMTNKETVRHALSDWEQQHQLDEDSQDVYELMFTFVAKDILEGCRPLLEGSLPDMIHWCLDKEFLHQAIILYEHEMPRYLWETGIFRPTMPEKMDYLGWLAEQLAVSEKEKETKTSEKTGAFPDPVTKKTGNSAENEAVCSTEKETTEQYIYYAYFWLNHYLMQSWPDLKSRAGESAFQEHFWENFDVCEITGNADGILETAALKAKWLTGLCGQTSGRVSTSAEQRDLLEMLTEYFMIQSQCQMKEYRVIDRGNLGKLWDYEETREVLQKALERYACIL